MAKSSDGAVKLGVVNGNEVISVSSCQTEILGMELVPPGEKRIIAVLL